MQKWLQRMYKSNLSDVSTQVTLDRVIGTQLLSGDNGIKANEIMHILSRTLARSSVHAWMHRR